MKRILFSLLVVLILSALLVPAVLAAPAYSSINVLNLGANDADTYIYYYDQSGALVPLPGGLTNPVHDVIPVGQAHAYFPHTSDGFNGSVVIESTEPIAVVSNILYLGPTQVQSSWNGFEQGASPLLFPLLMKGNNSNDSTFNVQNTTSASVHISIQFTPEPGMGYAVIPLVEDDIPAWAAHTYDLRVMSQFASIAKWVGSAKVTVVGAGAVAGVAQQLDSLRNAAAAYDAFVAGSPIVDMPLVMKYNGTGSDASKMLTSVNCQNLGIGPTDITINYVPEAGYPALAPETKTGIAENGTAVFIQYLQPKWVGAAQVTNSAGNNLACVGNQTNYGGYYLSTYEGFDAAMATNVAIAPLVQYQPQTTGNVYTSLNIKNLSTTTATNVTIDFKPQLGSPDVTIAPLPIAAGAVGVYIFYAPLGVGTSLVGGAEVSSDNGVALAVVVNQAKLNYAADFYSSYDGFAK